MMNMTKTPTQEFIDALFTASKALDEDLYVGDVFIDDEGVAKTSVIKVDGTVEQVVLNNDLQVKFHELTISSATKAETVSKLNAPTKSAAELFEEIN